jgi:hypothetical protein
MTARCSTWQGPGAEERERVRFGEEHGPRVLERAFLPDSGSSRQLRAEPVVLHFAFPPGKDAPRTVRSYFYSGEVQRMEALGSGVHRITFGDVR